jgi:hypothetical protein
MLAVHAGAAHYWRAAGACPSSVTSAASVAALHDHPPSEVEVDVVMRLQAGNGMARSAESPRSWLIETTCNPCIQFYSALTQSSIPGAHAAAAQNAGAPCA